ncbi:MAG: hypothetical protein FJX97_05160 [Bacteroidetes bacterium]|nr:hypothetical protein [Bacteroidota bacterium]
MKRPSTLVILLAITVFMVLGVIVTESFSEQGIAAYQDQFEEVGYFRNENNTGPVLRIYAFRTQVENPEVLKSFADLLPHTKYGRTLVFFVNEPVKAPVVLSPESPHFPASLSPSVFAKYEKTPMGEQQLELVNP